MTTNDMEQIDRIVALRKRLFNLIRAVDEGYHKSYEGALDITISLPGFFEPEDGATLKIELNCYLLCSGRGETFCGESIEDSIDRFETWIESKEISVFGETREWKYKKLERQWICETCVNYPPSACDGKPCCVCDPDDPLMNCYQRREDI